MNLSIFKAESINNCMQKDSKLIAEAYFKKLNEGMSVRPAPVQQPPKDEDEEVNLKNKLKDVIHQSSLTDEEKKACMSMIGLDQDDETADRTEQDPSDKSAIDYERERRAEEERAKWTQGQGEGGKFHF